MLCNISRLALLAMLGLSTLQAVARIGRADSIYVGVSASAHAYVPTVDREQHDDNQDSSDELITSIDALPHSVAASTSAAAGPGYASGSGRVTSQRDLTLRGGTITWMAGGKADSDHFSSSNGLGGYLASVNVSGKVVIDPRVAAPADDLYVAYGATLIPQREGDPFPAIFTDAAVMDIPGAGRTVLTHSSTGLINAGVQGGEMVIQFPTLHVADSVYPQEILMVLTWGVGILPGTSISSAFSPTDVVVVTGPGGQAVNEYTFAAPVQAGYGVGEFLYFDPLAAEGYRYHVSGSRFSQFILPEALPGGDSLFTLRFGGMDHLYRVGEAFDFTRFAPGGIDSFELLGIDLGAGLDPAAEHAPFVSGLMFTTAGLATVTQTALVSVVPEPSTLILLGLGLAGLMSFSRRSAARR